MKYHTIVLLAITFACIIIMPSSAQDTTISDTNAGVEYTIEPYVTANYPVALAFAPDGRLFFTEKNSGNVRVVSPDGELQTEPVITFPVSSVVERGMLGIALDPNYSENGFIWVAMIREATARDFATNQIIRFLEADGVGSDPEIMLDVPLENNALIHHGGNLHFDDESYLYYSIGDNENRANSQDITTMQGAIHRFSVTDDGLIPAEGNPFGDDNSIWAYGLRNSFDFAIDPFGFGIFATENGDFCDDEVNLILQGLNYGAGENYVCGDRAEGVSDSGYLQALVSFTPTIAPTGIIVYDHPDVPEWEGDVFFCAWTFGTLYRMELNEARTVMTDLHELDLGEAMCRIDIAIGLDGDLYFSSVGNDTGTIYRLHVME